jgi:formyl-CoA transferase
MHESTRDSNGALAGLKVVEFAHVIAGPLAGTLLADMGADVVHVEPPNMGDTGRHMGPVKDDVYLWWKVAARNKRSVSLDLRQERGRELARRLMAWADVVITNLRVGTLERWELDWNAARRVNPRVIYLQVSGYGATSAKRDRPGFGKVGEARSGVVHLTGFADGPPVHTGFSHGDSVAALMGAYGILAALHRKDTDPDFEGEWVDIALFEPLYRLIEWQVIIQDQLAQTPGRSGNRLSVAPAAVINTYRTADDEWIVVTSATLRSVINVAKLLGLDENEFQTVTDQVARADELDARLAEWVAQRSTQACLEAMDEAQVVASRIFTAADILDDPTYAERDDIISVDDDELGPVRMQAVIPHFHRHPGGVWRTGPRLGQDNDLVYRQWLGVPDADYSELKAAGVI